MRPVGRGCRVGEFGMSRISYCRKSYMALMADAPPHVACVRLSVLVCMVGT